MENLIIARALGRVLRSILSRGGNEPEIELRSRPTQQTITERTDAMAVKVLSKSNVLQHQTFHEKDTFIHSTNISSHFPDARR